MSRARAALLLVLGASVAHCGVRRYEFVDAFATDTPSIDAVGDGTRVDTGDAVSEAVDVPMPSDITDAPDAGDAPDAVDACTAVCSGACVDTETDSNNCGSCGHACAMGMACSAGVCGCPAGLTACGGSCVNTATDLIHCGSCGTVCPAGMFRAHPTCTMGVCGFACDPGYTLIGGICVVAPPRQLAPMSTTSIETNSPIFRVEILPTFTGGTLQVCRDPTCTTLVGSMGIAATRVASTFTLSAGVYYWRTRGMGGGGGGTSPAWEFVVPPTATTSSGSESTHGTLVDTNRDGTPEMLVTAPGSGDVLLYTGIAAPAATLHGVSGRAIQSVSAGDLNGDGFGDVAVAQPGAGGSPGTVRVYYGGGSFVTDPGTALTGGPAAPASFGGSVVGAGDLNRDGYGDLAVGAPAANQVFVFYGSAMGVATTPSVTLSSAAGAMNFGFSLAGAGDVTGDGFVDLVVSTPPTAASGAPGMIGIFPGGAAGVASSPMTAIDPSAPFLARIDGFGASLSTDGDVNGDFIPDILVGAPSGTDGGHAQIFYGSPTFPGTNLVVHAPSSGQFGASVAIMGSFSISGLVTMTEQFVIGSPTNGSGTATVFHLNGGTVTLDQTLSLSGATAFGSVVAGIGDFDHNNFDDVLVAAPGSTAAVLVEAPSSFGGVPTYHPLPPPIPTPSGFGTWVATRWLRALDRRL